MWKGQGRMSDLQACLWARRCPSRLPLSPKQVTAALVSQDGQSGGWLGLVILKVFSKLDNSVIL